MRPTLGRAAPRRAETAAASAALPPLKGSEKQVASANSLRTEWLAAVRHIKTDTARRRARQGKTAAEVADYAARYQARIDKTVASTTRAADWIKYGQSDTRRLLSFYSRNHGFA